MISRDDFYRLAQILTEIKDSVAEAEDILRKEGRIYNRAKVYWIAAIEMSLNNDHSYLGSCRITMQDTINELDDSVWEGEEEE